MRGLRLLAVCSHCHLKKEYLYTICAHLKPRLKCQKPKILDYKKQTLDCHNNYKI